MNKITHGGPTTGDSIIAVDDISFLNCETSYQPPGNKVSINITIVCVFVVNSADVHLVHLIQAECTEIRTGDEANSEIPFPSSALSAFDCSFEDGLCSWVQGGEDELDWLSRSGPTEAPNTGPAGDHTTGKGHYFC